jgi:hypothetical protein
MPANIFKRCVYSYMKPMWHNITEPSTVPMTAQEIMQEKFGGGFDIHLRPVTVKLNDENVETGDFAIIRGKSKFEDTERVFGYCTSRFHPLQPAEVAKCFDENVKEYAETMAFLGDGEDMFISWKMPTFEVGVSDEVEMYGIVRTGFDTLNGTRLFTSTYRPVCSNTINLAENWAKKNADGKGKGSIWSGKGVNKNLLRDLGYWMAHVQNTAFNQAVTLQNLFGRFAKTPLSTDSKVKALIERAYPHTDDVSPYYPAELREEKAENITVFNAGQDQIRDGIFRLFAGEGTAITPDFWGLLNSTSEYFCHYQASKKPIAESVMFGNRQKQIGRMLEVLTEEV